ncbi:lactate racemase domain-containing protein [Thalassoroseus pseudoceratinae]|uniref:lactate racemase domain-containing protein n=1 Tax=Thalassoroseus pseudoceratinae TaxID=2713176 RepID=UPI00141F1263|nr:lactate racemase domain-containing protein [Thalassoroseus pseudoceratinae]
MLFPSMRQVRQKFTATRVDNVEAETDRQLQTLGLSRVISPGQTVAIPAGSRGIANIDCILRTIVRHFQNLGAKPFIVPAMGSHGGGTVAGQTSILTGYGITEDFLGTEIRASMETVIVDRTPQGIPVHFDRHAYEADHVFICGRIKPHTGFVGEIESGLHKMMLIGLGKHEGAKIYHRAIQAYSFMEIIQSVSDVVLEKCGVIGGLAIVENAFDETGRLEAVAPDDFLTREIELLKLAREWMPQLPFREADLLIVERIGKDISGTGMDTNIVGRKFNDHAATEGDDTRIKRIFVRDLSDGTHGNGTGIGIAEFASQRALSRVDWNITRINAITGGHPTAAMVPLAWETERETLEHALQTIGLVEPHEAKVMRIYDTLHLENVWVSEAYADELLNRDDLELIDRPTPMRFDAAGNLEPVSAEKLIKS